MRALPLLLLLVGCSFLNRPDDPPDAEPVDAGPDAEDTLPDVPGDAPDAGMEVCNVFDDSVNEGDEDDDGMIDCADVADCEGMDCSDTGDGSCVCRNGRAVELACDNEGFDDDNDGTADCADFDCAGLNLDQCCSAGALPAHWPSMLCPTTGWDVGAGDANCEDTTLTELMATDPFALVWGDCLSLALGATFEIDVLPMPSMDPTCETGPCTEFIELLVAERDVPREGDGRFFAELGIVARPNGVIDVVQGDAPPAATTTVSGLTRLEVAFRPDISDTGVAELRATVTYDPPGDDETLLWEGFVVRLTDLITDGECASVPGFYLAIEGVGDAVQVPRFVASQSECSNPNLFRPSTDGVLTPYDYMESGTTSLELDPERLIDSPRDEPSWATQALSSPTLMRRGGEEDGDWMVAAEASNDQPANEPSFRVGYAIAYRDNSTWNDELTGWSGGSDRPWIGNQPPSCLDGSCDDPFSSDEPPYPSVRDPHLFETAAEMIAFAAEVPDGDDLRSERFGIYIARLDSFEDDSSVDSGTLVVAPDDVDECDSLRDPIVTSRPGAGEADHWLFFTCYSGLSSRGIFAVPVVGTFSFAIASNGDDEAIARPVLQPQQLDFGRGGTLRAPELVLDDDGGETFAFGMWFLVGQEVGLATGAGKAEYPGDEMRWTTPDLPVFQLFAGNPVLIPSDRVLSRTCAGCSIEGLAVTRTTDTSLRFLIARENDDTPARYDLLPLDQTWRNLARP